MADYTNSKDGLGAVYPENTVDSDWTYTQPLISPEDLKTLFLLGIDLVSNTRSVLTQKREPITDPQLKTFIINAASIAELETKIDILPKQIDESVPYDKPQLNSYGFIQLRHRPVQSIESIEVTTSSNQVILDLTKHWVNTGLLHQGQINIMPFSALLQNFQQGGPVLPAFQGSGQIFNTMFGGAHWVPQFFRVKYTVGFKDSKIPIIINQLIGAIAAMEILSLLAATYARSNSSSLSIDGLSQSISSPGPNIYTQRLTDLGEKRKALIGKIQALFNMNIIMDNV